MVVAGAVVSEPLFRLALLLFGYAAGVSTNASLCPCWGSPARLGWHLRGVLQGGNFSCGWPVTGGDYSACLVVFGGQTCLRGLCQRVCDSGWGAVGRFVVAAGGYDLMFRSR